MTNIFVGSLSYKTTEEDLHSAFAEFGTVERVSVVRDRVTGQPRGFAFVEMPNRDEATRAIENMNGRELNGWKINVNEARPREDRPRTGGGGGGGFNRGGGRGGSGGGGGSRREPRW